MGARLITMSAVPPPAAAVAAHPRVYNSSQVADEVQAESTLLESRRTLYAELRKCEANEQTTTEKRIADEHTTACRLAEERDQCIRATEADAIAVRAAEEHRIR